MSAGLWVLLGSLLMVGVLVGVQWWMGRQARALVGEPVPASVADQVPQDGIVWFHSPSCGPCKAMRPQVAALDDGQAWSVDVSQDLETARAFGVMATPTTVRVRAGRVLEVRTGALGPDALQQLLA